MSEAIKPMPFTSWIFSVNFGDVDLYMKHRAYMQLAYESRDKEVQFYIDQAEQLKQQLEAVEKENRGLKMMLNHVAGVEHVCDDLEAKLAEAVEVIESFYLEATFDLDKRDQFLAKYRGGNDSREI